MVGGVVIEVAALKDKVFIDTRDRDYNYTCGIYVEKNENSLQIEIGDSIWWQGRFAMWTPAENRSMDITKRKCGVDFDIQIPRIGYSGASLPERPKDVDYALGK